MEVRIVCDKVVWMWCGLLVSSPVIRVNGPLVDETPREGIYDN